MDSDLILLLTGKDPWADPTGGQTTFARHLIMAFGSQMAVSSHSEDPRLSKGKWIKRTFEGEKIWFFNRGPLKNDHKPPYPERIEVYLKAKKFMFQLWKNDFKGILLDAPELLFAAKKFHWRSACYSFAGVNNPVENSRYLWARFFGTIFEKYFIQSLKQLHPDVMIAAADTKAIEGFLKRIAVTSENFHLHKFPTRVDTNLFKPIPKASVREKLNIPQQSKVIVATGRLCWVKGWDLILKSVSYLKRSFPDILVFLVGDGEDHSKILNLAKALGITENVRITGFLPQEEVVCYMNAADVCIVGSYKEGWSVAMCEMIACGKKIVSTDVSGATDMIIEGLNGYIAKGRDPKNFAKTIKKAIDLPSATEHSLKIAKKFSLSTLRNDLKAIWPLLQ